MSFPNGVRKEVVVYVFDVNNAVQDSRRRRLQAIRPDFVVRGSKHHCGQEIARNCFRLGFSSVKNFFDYAVWANFADAEKQAELFSKRMEYGKEKLGEALKSEVK